MMKLMKAVAHAAGCGAYSTPPPNFLTTKAAGWRRQTERSGVEQKVPQRAVTTSQSGLAVEWRSARSQR